MQEPERLLSLLQLKELMGVSMSSLMRHRGEPPLNKARKFGKRVFVPLSAYNEWAKNNNFQDCMEKKDDITE